MIPYTPVIVFQQCDNFCGTVTCDGICFSEDDCMDVTFDHCGKLDSISLMGSFAGTIKTRQASPTRVDEALWDQNGAHSSIELDQLCDLLRHRRHRLVLHPHERDWD